MTTTVAVSEGVHSKPAARLSPPAAAVPSGEAGVNVNGRTWPVRWKTVLMDSFELLGLVLSVPVAVLLVGAPIALAIALLLWLGRLTLRAF